MCPAATTLIARIKDQFKTVEDMETVFKKMDLNCNGKITKVDKGSVNLCQFSGGDAKGWQLQ